jgi:hypothetical protein
VWFVQNHCRDLRPNYDHLLRYMKAAQVIKASKSASCRRGYGKELTDRLFGLRKRAESGKYEVDKRCTALDIEHRLVQGFARSGPKRFTGAFPRRPSPPPRSPQTIGMVERFNGRIEDVLQSHHFQSDQELQATLHRYVWLCNQQLPQSALGSKSPLQAMKDWHKIRPELFKKQPYYRPGCNR